MTIDDIITGILQAEGWDRYTNLPADRGGPTKWGITLKSFEDFVRRPCTPEDIKDIDETMARAFYKKKYIVAPNFLPLCEPLRTIVIDAAVHSGPTAASKWLQRAVGVLADGKVGPKTLAAVLHKDPLATAIRVIAQRQRLLSGLVSKDPELRKARQHGYHLQAEFALGWTNRVTKLLDGVADCLDDR